MRLHYDDGVQYVIHENINQDELDRDGRISFSTFFKWMQSARMALPWLGCKYVNLASADPAIVDRRLFAVSQFLSLTADVQYAGATVAVECRIGKVGKSSIQFVYRLLHAPEGCATFSECGHGVTTMVCVAGHPGRPTPLPDSVAKLAGDAVPLPPLPSPDGDALHVHKVLVRYSDEDVNHHANHTAAARFMYDAFTEASKETLRFMYLVYKKEIKARDECKVEVRNSVPFDGVVPPAFRASLCVAGDLAVDALMASVPPSSFTVPSRPLPKL